jgi:hypothetical protein
MLSPDAMVPRAAPERAARTRNLRLARMRRAVAACLLAGLAGCAQILGIDELSTGGERDAAVDARQLPDDSGIPPARPELRSPMNGSRLGSLFSRDSLRPTLTWDPSPGGASSYVLEYGTDPDFGAGATRVELDGTSHRPEVDLEVKAEAPVGARYYWRVTACRGMACAEPTPAWYFDVGRQRRDVNGDGHDDVLVGAPVDAEGQNLAGAVYVFAGGPGVDFDEQSDGKIVSLQDSEQMGMSVASGDFNGDGFADVVAGAPLYLNERGRFHVYAGSAQAPGAFASPVTVDGPGPETSFGATLVTGDFNGDGFSDLVVGDLGPGPNIDQVGHVSVYLGGPGNFNGDADQVINGFQVGDGFGSAVANAGDLNGDGYDDLVVGVAGEQRANIYFGGPEYPFDDLPPAIVSELDAPGFGKVVAGAGDVDGDGYHDVLVAATTAGLVFLYRGGPEGLDTVAGAKLLGATQGPATGVAAGGDMNRDGRGDFLIARATASGAGEILLYTGASPLPADPFTTMGGLGGGMAGAAMSDPADFNGDGFDDIVVGNGPDIDVQVYLGDTLTNPAEARLRGTTDDVIDQFGFSVGP